MFDRNSHVEESVPLQFRLSQNYPNPFKETTTIKYCVAYRTRVVLRVLDAERKEIERLVDEEKKAGTYEVEFCAAKGAVPDGKESEIYHYTLEAGSFRAERQMQLITQKYKRRLP
jgi:hypothetical protein